MAMTPTLHHMALRMCGLHHPEHMNLPFMEDAERYLNALALWQGACGYGYLQKDQWPYWSVGALTPNNSFAQAGPAHACGCAAVTHPACHLLHA